MKKSMVLIYRFCLDGSNIKKIIYRFCRILNNTNINMKMKQKTWNGQEQLHNQDSLVKYVLENGGESVIM